MPQKSIFDLFGEKSPARMVTVKSVKKFHSCSSKKDLNFKESILRPSATFPMPTTKFNFKMLKSKKHFKWYFESFIWRRMNLREAENSAELKLFQKFLKKLKLEKE